MGIVEVISILSILSKVADDVPDVINALKGLDPENPVDIEKAKKYFDMGKDELMMPSAEDV